MTSEMDESAVDMNTAGAGDDMPDADETDVMEGDEGSVGVETGLMPGESSDVAAETEMTSGEEMNGASDPMGGQEMSMSVTTGKNPIELAGNWKLTLSISS